jgi:hypothetical protein
LRSKLLEDSHTLGNVTIAEMHDREVKGAEAPLRHHFYPGLSVRLVELGASTGSPNGI